MAKRKIELPNIVVALPAYNEEDNIENVIKSIKAAGLKNVVVGVDRGTTDNTAKILAKQNVPYVISKKRGFDPTLFAATQAIPDFFPNCSYLFFTDAGEKFSYESTSKFIEAAESGYDLVMGKRVLGRNNLFWKQKIGTELVLSIIWVVFGKKVKDNSPLRLISYDLFRKLDMQPKSFRWTTEMLVKCLALKASFVEIPVRALPRQGKSKISGSLKKSLKVGCDMLSAFKFINFKTKV